MSVIFDFDIGAVLARMDSSLREAVVETLWTVEEDIEPFVPYDTGELYYSEEIDESDMSLVWEADYAQYVYDMPKNYNFNRTVNEYATSHWLDEPFVAYKNKWVELLKDNVDRKMGV